MDENAKRLVKGRGNSRRREDQTVGYVRRELLKALAALDGLEDDAHKVPLEKADRIRIAGEALDSLDRYLPKVEAWCLVKVYGSPGWKPAVWWGCTNKAQAEALCAVATQRYPHKSHWPESQRDTWRVEYRACEMSEMVDPRFTPADWLAEPRS